MSLDELLKGLQAFEGGMQALATSEALQQAKQAKDIELKRINNEYDAGMKQVEDMKLQPGADMAQVLALQHQLMHKDARMKQEVAGNLTTYLLGRGVEQGKVKEVTDFAPSGGAQFNADLQLLLQQQGAYERLKLAETEASAKLGAEARKEARDLAKEERKRKRELTKYHVNIFDLKDPEVQTPTDIEIKEFRNSTTASLGIIKQANTIRSRFKDLRETMKTQGAFTGDFQKIRGEIGTLLSEMAVNLKEKYGLGAITGPDMSLLENVIGISPAGGKEGTFVFDLMKATDNKAARLAMDKLESHLNVLGTVTATGLLTKAKVLGYQLTDIGAVAEDSTEEAATIRGALKYQKLSNLYTDRKVDKMSGQIPLTQLIIWLEGNDEAVKEKAKEYIKRLYKTNGLKYNEGDF